MEGNDLQNLELLDIYDVWYNPWWHQTWFMVLCIVSGLLAIAVLGFVIYKKFFSRVIAMSGLEQIALEMKKLKNLETMDQSYFYASLTTLLKKACQEAYHVSVVHKTDDEFINFIGQEKMFDEELVASLKTIFDGVAVIKFAHQKTVQDHMERSLKVAVEVVNKLVKARKTQI